MANVRDVNGSHSNTADVCSIQQQSDLQTLEGLVQSITEKINLIKEVEANAKAADDQYVTYEHKLQDTQRENRILIKEKHNCRKEGHIKIANLKTELQKQHQAEKKIRQKLNATLSELKQKKAENFKLVKQTDNENHCITKLHALTQQKREDIQRMDSLVGQQQLCWAKLQEEQDQLQAALKGGGNGLHNNQNMLNQKHIQHDQLQAALKGGLHNNQNMLNQKDILFDPTVQNLVLNDTQRIKSNTELEGQLISTQTSPDTEQEQLQITDEGRNSLQKANASQQIVQEKQKHKSNDDEAAVKEDKEQVKIKRERECSKSQKEDLGQVGGGAQDCHYAQRASREASVSNESVPKPGSLQDVISTTTSDANKENNLEGARQKTVSISSNDLDRDNKQITDMPLDQTQLQKRNITKTKVTRSVFPIHDDSSQGTKQRSEQVKMESTETNKKLVRLYGQEIKEKVNVINSLLDKIAKS